MKKTNVLVFPAGAENALEIYDALHEHMDIDVFGASGKADYASFLYPEDHYVEDNFYITDPGFFIRFNAVIQKWNIDVVIPTHDEVALFFARNREKINAKLLLSPVETAEVCREKRKMYNLFKDADFCPKFWDSMADTVAADFPVFAKPNSGAGARNTFLLEDLSSAEKIPELEQLDMIFCEYLPGEECTVDCYSNTDGELLFSGVRTRDRISNGIAVRSTTVELTNEIRNICECVNERLRFFGAWYLQLKKDKKGSWKLLEISCRQAGGMTLYRHKGINFPMMGIYELNGIPVRPLEQPGVWRFERRLTARFQLPYQFDDVYVDLDDTLIVKGKVNTTLMAFLYQCVNEQKKIHLITRHDTIPEGTLTKNKISKDLFDSIIHITFEDDKEDYICGTNAIFIDNSFAERKRVFEKKGTPAFDVDAVDCLLHYKHA